jgi:asparagine synthase (glutamine-hydrolysing)
MAGLCAIVRFDDAPVDAAALTRMADAARHRGTPTRHLEPHAHLAHLGHGHRAGLATADDGTAVVASARLDNRRELLPALRAHLTTPEPGDAELILAAYRRWGSDVAAHLLGDFAFVVHDAPRRRVLAARDPMGMRPLFLHADARRVLLASEIQQLLGLDGVPVEIHDPAVARYLIGEFGVPDETFYRDVRAVPAGHVLEVDGDGSRSRPFWGIDPERRERFAREEDYAARFRELFLGAVEDRLRVDDEPALFLSGGVDSGSIAAAAGWLREQGRVASTLTAYTWAFDTLTQCDERHLSDLVVRRYGMRAADVDAEASAPLARYPEHGPHRDEPYVGVYQALLETGLAAARRGGARSVWSGDRGDLLAGAWTPSYVALARRGRWRDLAGEMREHAALPGASWPGVAAAHLLRPAARAALGRLRHPRRAPSGPRHDVRRPPWLLPAFLQRTGVDPAVVHDPEAPSGLGYARRFRHGLVFMPVHMRGMVWSERTHAAFGLGFVDPWSDRRLAEFVVAMPQAVLDRPGELRKRLVREAMRGIMPEELRRGAAKIVPTPLYHRALRETGVDRDPHAPHRHGVGAARLPRRRRPPAPSRGGDRRRPPASDALVRRHAGDVAPAVLDPMTAPGVPGPTRSRRPHSRAPDRRRPRSSVLARTPMTRPLRLLVLHRGDPPRRPFDPWASEAGARVERLAAAIAASGAWPDHAPATLVVRHGDEPLIAARRPLRRGGRALARRRQPAAGHHPAAPDAARPRRRRGRRRAARGRAGDPPRPR